MSLGNLKALWQLRDQHDHREGLLAYSRYRKVMAAFAKWYGFSVADTTSAFVALSPNSDYHGNLRSLASVMRGVARDHPTETITVSTYNACRDRAVSYLTGEADFLRTVKGPKITAFRDNILRPRTSRLVTVDGHMIAAWYGEALTMKEAQKRLRGGKTYTEIAADVSTLATMEGVAPCQAQAILWLTRKRVYGVKYSPQLDLFAGSGDMHRTVCSPADFPPYERKLG